MKHIITVIATLLFVNIAFAQSKKVLNLSNGSTPQNAPIATPLRLGVIRVGNGLAIEPNGLLRITGVPGTGDMIKFENLAGLANVPAARANLGATALGSGFFTMPNTSTSEPSYPQINFNNTVSHLTSNGLRAALGINNVLNVVQEPALGNPTVNGYVLASTITGFRSWVAAPTGTGGGSDSAFVDFTTAVANTVAFRRGNGQIQNLVINIPPSLAAVRRVPGSLQVQGLISGVWTNQDFTDSIGAGGGGGAAGYHGDTLFLTTTDGNLSLARTIIVSAAEAVDIDVNYIAIKSDNAGAVVGRINTSAFKTVGGVLTVGGNQYPRTEVYYGTVAGTPSANITNNAVGGIAINMIGAGASTYTWKIWYTVKRHKIAL